MKKTYIYPLLAALFLPLAFASCMGDDDDEVVYSEDCYITSLTLGTLKRNLYVTGSDGKEIATTTFSGSAFPMTIDQRAQTIENLDSLPVRTKTDKVLTTIAFQGVLVWRKATPANEDEEQWQTYSSKDSMDLSEPLHLRVVSASGLSSRTYTLKVNVHQQQGDSTTWNNMGTASALTHIGERKAIVKDGRLLVIGVEATTGALTCAQRPVTATGDWNATTTTITNAIPATVQVQNGNLYVSTTDGNILESTDGQTWTAAAYPSLTGLRLIAASNDYLYARVGQELWRSDGGPWEQEKLDATGDNLPSDGLSSVFYTMPNGMLRLFFAGSRNATDKEATLWAKTWQKGNEDKAAWTYYTPNAADKFRLPMMENLCVVPYDGGLQALGGKSRDGQHTALDSIFHSRDHGVTWKTYASNEMDVDPDLKAIAETAQYLCATVDENNFLWIIADDKVWRGRINRLGFLRK